MTTGMSSTSTPSSGKRRRRWFQFSLRSMLVVTLLFSVWLGILAHRARQQREAVWVVLNAGGMVWYDDGEYESESRTINPKGSASGLDWLRTAIGEEYFREVRAVSLRDNSITDENLRNLMNFTNLEYLDLSNTRVTSADLIHLAGLTKLRNLSLEDTQVGDAGLQHLEQLEDLRELSLNGTQVTDAGLENIGDLTNLMFLRLNHTQVTDASAPHLKRLTKLRLLEIRDTKLTAEGIRALELLPGSLVTKSRKRMVRP